MPVLLALLLTLFDQTLTPNRILNPTNTNPGPGDPRLAQFDLMDVAGANWRIFAVDVFPQGPIAITQVDEVRQQNPPSRWAVFAGNRELMPVASFTLAAAVVDITGKIKATQVLPAIRNLTPQQVQRREIGLRAIVAPTDRVVFYVNEVKSETGDWKADPEDVAALIKAAAQKLKVP